MAVEESFPSASREALLEAADAAFDSREYNRALDQYRLAHASQPEDTEARMGIALSLIYLRRFEEAIPCLMALEPLMPASDQLQFMLSDALFQAGRRQEAQERLEKLVAKSPTYVDAQNRLGMLYLDRGQYPEANRCFAVVLELNPAHVDALCCMGLMMIKFCQFDNALAVLHKALAIDPANVLALNNLGRACKMLGRHGEALGWYRKALETDPANLCVIGNYLLALNYCDGLAPEFIASEHFRLAPRYKTSEPQVNPAVPQTGNGERLRVGYISGDFYTHSVAYFLEPILQHHDHKRFEIICYSLGTTSDATTTRLKTLACHWRDMAAESPERLFRQIREDRVNILVDLAGHTADNRLATFALRAAPVQISWLGYPNTTGLEQMDYYLTDSDCDPPGMTDHLFRERLWRLPRIFCSYLPPMEFPPIGPSPSLSNGFVTFGSFNNFAKVTASMITLWSHLLLEVPNSRLYLKSMSLGDKSVNEGVLAAFAAEGVTVDRIQMRTVTSTPLEHLEEYSRVDIALDTYPYHGTTTTCEALWMGTPVITLAGNTHASRVGVSILRHVGCADCIAYNSEEYLSLAVALASSPAQLAFLRERLRGMMARSALMDYAGITREVEAAFTAMHEAKCHEAKCAT